MATQPRAPSFLDEKTAIDRIQAIVGNARTVWFALLAFLAFIGLTLTSVRDLDFFSADATTQLPIVNIAIPTTTFFWSAAWLAAILHTYFHLYLLKLWDVLAEAPPTIGGARDANRWEMKYGVLTEAPRPAGAPLGDRVFPWLVVDWALRRRPDRPTAPRPMDWLASAVTWLVIWLATPLMLAAFWWRSMPAHDARMTLAIGAALLLSLFATLRGWRRARRRLTNPGVGDTRVYWRSRRRLDGLRHALGSLTVLALWLLMLAAFPGVVLASIAGAGWHHFPAIVDRAAQSYWPAEWGQPPLVPIDLVNAEIVRRPADWLARDSAERRFKVTWCRDRQIPADACERPTEPYHTAARTTWCEPRDIEDCPAEFQRLDAAFAAEWREQRSEYLINLTRPDLRGRDLRGASASGAFLAGVNATEARLEDTQLEGATLEGATLVGAQLNGADLSGARLEKAVLSGATLSGAALREARLEGASLAGADLEKADLRGARLDEANLEEVGLQGADLGAAHLKGVALQRARLQEANLQTARLQGANLRGAWLERANLHGAQLQGANLADAQATRANLFMTVLEGANLTGAQLEEANLENAQLKRTLLVGTQFKGANLFGAWLDEANLFRARLDGADLTVARLRSVNLYEAQLEGANLDGIELDGADLTGVSLKGTNLRQAKLRSAGWAGATFGAAPAHSADLTGGRNLTQSQLAHVIGNSETILPLDAETGEQLYVWTCWREPPPNLTRLLEMRSVWEDEADLRAEWLCPPGVAPERTGRPADPAPAAPSAD